jgi:hypothetical protein
MPPRRAEPRRAPRQGCNALADAGLAALAAMTSLAAVNLQDCRQVTGARGGGLFHCLNFLSFQGR